MPIKRVSQFDDGKYFTEADLYLLCTRGREVSTDDVKNNEWRGLRPAYKFKVLTEPHYIFLLVVTPQVGVKEDDDEMVWGLKRIPGVTEFQPENIVHDGANRWGKLWIPFAIPDYEVFNIAGEDTTEITGYAQFLEISRNPDLYQKEPYDWNFEEAEYTPEYLLELYRRLPSQ